MNKIVIAIQTHNNILLNSKNLITEALKIVGPEAMKELKILYRECANQRSRGEFSDTKLQQKVFEEAYQSKLE